MPLHVVAHLAPAGTDKTAEQVLHLRERLVRILDHQHVGRDQLDALLDGFGLLKGDVGNRVPNSRINKISGGEHQRVALARAIAHNPALVFVDEPTASLNQVTARRALRQLRLLQRDSGNRTVVVMITHDNTLAAEFSDLIVQMEAVSATAGRVADILTNLPQEMAIAPAEVPA